MKRCHPDIQGVLTQKYVTELSFLRRFKRYWGTTVIAGEEVFVERKQYFPASAMDESTKKLAKLLRISSSLQGPMEGIKSAWLYLNIDNDPEAGVITSGVTNSSNMNTAIQGMTKGSVLISSKVRSKGHYDIAPITTPVSDQAGLIAEIEANYQSYWDNGYAIFSSSTDSYEAIFLMYLLRSTDVPYTITKVEQLTVPVSYPPRQDAETIKVDAQPAWKVTFEVTNPVVTESTDIIQMLAEDLAGTSDLTAVLQVKQHMQMAFDVNDSAFAAYARTYEYNSPKWLKVGSKYYLKASALTDQSTSMQERSSFLMKCVDTGYRKKKLKWYEVLLIVIIIIVSLYFGNIAGVKAGATMASAAWAAVVTVSVTITLAALYIGIIAYALGAAGLTRMSMAMGEFLKTVEPLVRVASVVSFVAALASVWKEALKKAAKSAATSAATEVSVIEIAKITTRTLIEQVTGVTSLANVQFADAVKMMDFVIGAYTSDQTKQMERMIKNYRKELSDIYAADEQNKTSDILKDFALTYPDLLAQDESVYANIYDRPYEWWSTPYHIGCIQANTVNALWLSKD